MPKAHPLALPPSFLCRLLGSFDNVSAAIQVRCSPRGVRSPARRECPELAPPRRSRCATGEKIRTPDPEFVSSPHQSVRSPAASLRLPRSVPRPAAFIRATRASPRLRAPGATDHLGIVNLAAHMANVGQPSPAHLSVYRWHLHLPCTVSHGLCMFLILWWKGRDSNPRPVLTNQQVTDRKGAQFPSDPPVPPDLPVDLPVARVISN